MRTNLRIVIDARRVPGIGAESVRLSILGFIWGLGKLQDADDEYLILVHADAPDWPVPYLGPNQRIVVQPRAEPSARRARIKKTLGPFLPAARCFWRPMQRLMTTVKPPHASDPLIDGDPFIESLQPDVVHFMNQHLFARTSAPATYNPYDFVLFSHPEWFTQAYIAERGRLISRAIGLADAVCVQNSWSKQEAVRLLGVDPTKVFIVPFGCFSEFLGHSLTEKDIWTVKEKYQLPSTYALYPARIAVTKNHIRLLEAVALLRDRDGFQVRLVCTGKKEEFWPEVEACMWRLRLEDQVAFLGFIPMEDLPAIYKMARCVVFPSLFEGIGMPTLEALGERIPLTCSNIPVLSQQLGDAALYFDPYSVEEIAAALNRICSDANLRESLISKGARLIRFQTWERSARILRAVYRHMAGLSLSYEDVQLLSI